MLCMLNMELTCILTIMEVAFLPNRPVYYSTKIRYVLNFTLHIYSYFRLKEYIDSPWNLNNLPTLNGSVFKHINVDINGMMYVTFVFIILYIDPIHKGNRGFMSGWAFLPSVGTMRIIGPIQLITCIGAKLRLGMECLVIRLKCLKMQWLKSRPNYSITNLIYCTNLSPLAIQPHCDNSMFR